MKTYILKHPVYNDIDFPIGTVIRLIDLNKFEVIEGKLNRKIGEVADGLQGWLIDDTEENRKTIKSFFKRKSEIEKQMAALDKELESLEPAIITHQ